MIKAIIRKTISFVSYLKNKIKSFSGIDTRPSTEFFKKHFKDQPLIGIEIGVFKGDNAKNLLENLNIEKLYLVDSYEKLYIKDEDIVPSMMEESEYSAFLQKELGFSGIVFNFEKCYELAKKKLRKFSNKIIFIKKNLKTP